MTPPALTTLPTGDPARLLVTDTGQLSTAMGGETLRSLVRARAEQERATPPPGESEAGRLARLRTAIRDVARTTATPGADAAPVGLGAETKRDGYYTTPLTLAVDGVEVAGMFAAAEGAGRKPTLLLLGLPPQPNLNGVFATWTQAGWNVLALEPRGAGGTEELKSPLTGDWTLLSLRALLVGRTPVGLRVDDVLSAVNWLSGRAEVDPRQIAVQGAGALGPVALHAAVMDDRISQVTTVNAIVSYRDFVERPISRDMAEVNLPGVLRRYDLPDLMAVLGRRLTLVNPVNSIGETLNFAEVSQIAPAARVVFSGARDAVTPPPSPSRR